MFGKATQGHVAHVSTEKPIDSRGCHFSWIGIYWSFPVSSSEESACIAGGSISGSGRSPVEGNGYPFQYSCWKNPLDRGSWWVSISKLCPGSGQTLTLRSADQKPPGKGFQWWAESRFQAGSVQLLHQWLRSAGGKTFHEESGRKYLWLCRPLGLCHTYLCLVSMHVSRLRRSLNDCTWLYSNKTL